MASKQVCIFCVGVINLKYLKKNTAVGKRRQKSTKRTLRVSKLKRRKKINTSKRRILIGKLKSPHFSEGYNKGFDSAYNEGFGAGFIEGVAKAAHVNQTG
jgi:hypothetical protein